MLSKSLENTLQAALAQASLQRHEYATLEHLLFALLNDQNAAAVLSTCLVDLDQLHADLMNFITRDLAALVVEQADSPMPTAGFQRVVQRACLQMESSGRGEVTGADILVSLFSESESHAAHFLQRQGITEASARTAVAETAAKRAWVFIALCPGPSAEEIRIQGIMPAIHATGHLTEQDDAVNLAEGVTGAALAQIRRSRLVIADYTQAGGAVDFVVGIAVGAGIPVITTCLDGVAGLHPSDIRNRDMLIWQTPEELSDELAQRISAVIGRSAAETEDNTDEAGEAVILDSLNVAIKKLVERGRKQGYVTSDEFNAALSVAQVSPELIEDVMSMLQEQGIAVLYEGDGGTEV
jgi:hypothetical protein